MIRIQQGLFSLTLVILCSTVYAVTSAPVNNAKTSATVVTPATTTITTTTKTNKTDTNKTDTNTTGGANATGATKTDTASTSDTATDDTSANSTTDIYADSVGDTTESAPAKDVFEPINRIMFRFNETVDKYIMKPVAKVYNVIMPKPLNQGVHNFFNNIGTLPTIANDVLQFNFYQAANDTWRVLINSTVGIGGLFDVGSRIGLNYYSNDFGLTLAKWGWKSSNYLVLPFFGPSSPRDTLGLPVDYFAFSVYPHINPQSLRYQVYGLGVVDRRAQLLKFQEVLEEATFDKYVFIRNAYLQRRAHQIEETHHLSYNERDMGQPVAETGQTVAADAEATAEPLQPSGQPIESGKPEVAQPEQKQTTVQPDATAE